MLTSISSVLTRIAEDSDDKWERHDEAISSVQQKTIDSWKEDIKMVESRLFGTGLSGGSLGMMLDKIVSLARQKFPEGHDYHGGDYLNQTMSEAKILKDWKDYEDANWATPQDALDGIRRLEAFAERHIRELKAMPDAAEGRSAGWEGGHGGNTQLHEQAMAGDPAVLDHPAVSTETNDDGHTALHLLAMKGHKGVLKHPGAWTVKDNNGNTPGHLLALKNVRDVMDAPEARTVPNHNGDTAEDILKIHDSKLAK